MAVGRSALQAQLSRPGALILVLAGAVPGEATPAISPVDILVYERHAARASDDALTRFADHLGALAAIEFHLSMEDALLAPFTDRIGEVLQRLGANEHEAISNNVLTRVIANAQCKARDNRK